MKTWHMYSVEEIEKELNTNIENGLSSVVAASRYDKLKKDSKNKEYSLFVPEKRGVISALLTSLWNPFVISLIALSLLCGILGKQLMAYGVFALTLITVLVVGYLVSRSYERTDSMKNYSSPMVNLRRSGRMLSTDGRNLVPGDVIVLKPGDILPCDARIIKSSALSVDELHVVKGNIVRQRVFKSGETDYSDSSAEYYTSAENILFAGTAVVEGFATAIVTEVGRSIMLAEYLDGGALAGKEKSPMWLNYLRPVSFRISCACTALMLLLPIVGLITLNTRTDLFSMILTLIASVLFAASGFFTLASSEIFSQTMFSLSKNKRRQNKIDNYAALRGFKAIDILSGVTDLVLLGSAGVVCGEYRISKIFTADCVLHSLDNRDERSERLLSFIHTYIYARKRSQAEKDYYTDGILDALDNYVKECGFDFEGADTVLRSSRFEVDLKSGYSYAYIETNTEFYRVALVRNARALNFCSHIRDGEDIRQICEKDVENIVDFCNSNADSFSSCVFIIYERDSRTVLEAVIPFRQSIDKMTVEAVKQLRDHGVYTSLMLCDDSNEHLTESEIIKAAFGSKAVSAADFNRDDTDIRTCYRNYSIFSGFDKTVYLDIIKQMKKDGATVAVFALDNQYNEMMAAADIGVSCDTLRYSSDKHRESFYESLPSEGTDRDIRASQQTRLLSKVIVRRSNVDGGGISAFLNAVKTSRNAYLSFSRAISLFVMLSSILLSFTVMSFLCGSVMLDPLQTVLLSVSVAVLSVLAFADTKRSGDEVKKRYDYIRLPLGTLIDSDVGVIARSSVVVILSVVIRIIEHLGYFGSNAAHTVPVFICVLISYVVELYVARLKFSGKEKTDVGCWRVLLLVYSVLILYLAYASWEFIIKAITNAKLFFELLIIPAYLLLYACAIAIAHLIDKKRKR